MNFSIKFGEQTIGEISKAHVDSFSFISSIFRMYSGAKFVIKDATKTLNNCLKTGMKVTVTFFNDTKSYENKMRVLSFNKKGSGEVVDFIEVVLVSAMYFEEVTKTMTYSGSVSSIITDVFNNVFKETNPTISFCSTEDRTRRRYQLAEKTQDFLKKIIKYGIKSGLPVYLYSAPNGIMYLKGVYDMISDNPKIVASSMLASQLIQLPKNSGSLSELVFFGHSFGINTRDSFSSVKNIFCTKNFKFSTQLPDEVSYNGTEVNNSQSEVSSPSKTRFFNWNYTPDDAQAIAIRDAFEETINTFTMTASFKDFLVDELTLGTCIFVILPFDPTTTNSTGSKINLGEGKYLITQVSYIYENKTFKTVASLSQIAS